MGRKIMLDIRFRDEKPVDITDTRCVSSTGTLTYELNNQGIYAYYATHEDGEFTKMPILKDSFRFEKITDELVNDIKANYYKNNDTNNHQSTYEDTDTTLSKVVEKEINLDFISDATTVEALSDLMFAANAKRAYVAQYDTNMCGIGLDMFQVINLRHELIRNIFTDMNNKKWVVCGIKSSVNPLKLTLTAVELL